MRVVPIRGVPVNSPHRNEIARVEVRRINPVQYYHGRGLRVNSSYTSIHGAHRFQLYIRRFPCFLKRSLSPGSSCRTPPPVSTARRAARHRAVPSSLQTTAGAGHKSHVLLPQFSPCPPAAELPADDSQRRWTQVVSKTCGGRLSCHCWADARRNARMQTL